jgi:hypothetical protein
MSPQDKRQVAEGYIIRAVNDRFAVGRVVGNRYCFPYCTICEVLFTTTGPYFGSCGCSDPNISTAQVEFTPDVDGDQTN